MAGFVLVTNAAAGSHDEEAVAAARHVLRGAGEVEVVSCEQPHDLDPVLAQLAGRAVVVAGGDGSLHTVVNALHRLDLLGEVRLGLVPLGTGNDFARGVEIPLDPAEAATVVAAGHTRRVDLVVDDVGIVVVNNAHLGVGAQASQAATRWKPRLGRVGYAVGALQAGVRPRFLHARVCVDGVDVMPRGHIAQVAVGNGSHVGGGTELIPGADPTTGRLVVIVSRAVGRSRRLAYLARLRGGTHHLMEEVERVTGEQVVVEATSGHDGFWLSVDGEISGPHRRRAWRVLPGAVAMFLPPPPASPSSPAASPSSPL